MGELSTIRFQISTEPKTYTGVELRPHFLLSEMGLKGSGIGIFQGPCQVKTEHLVDWEDRLAHDRIEAAKMIHFIGEFFGMSLNEGVLTQRFFMATVLDVLNQLLRAGASPKVLDSESRVEGDSYFYRTGDDLWWGVGSEQRKLSVSIVTATPVSVLMHVGLNIDPAGAPVAAVGLSEIGIDPNQVIVQVKDRFLQEWEDMKWACTKVRPMV